ncbi:MAG: XRE family transcriptional regulator [Deltaproteobacteria bacterium]|nr:XRE family transcriptional regulator [Deltaproteobacteria bacterium]
MAKRKPLVRPKNGEKDFSRPDLNENPPHLQSYINAKIITWARERAGFTIEALAEKMGRDPDEIESWERGLGNLSYSTLEQLAYKHLKLPLAVFFFPELPVLEDPTKKFRRLPSYELERFSPDTYQKIHLGQAYQYSLSFLLEDIPIPRRVFRDLSPDGLEPNEFAKNTRKYLGVTLQQQNLFRSCETAFKAWRHAIEEAAVFTFKDSFDDRFISGFSILEDDYPIIFVNNSNSFARQVFTLIHELGHILYGVSGVTDIDESYIEMMEDDQRTLEVKCNKFAAHLLVPDESFQQDIRYFQAAGADAVSEIAQRYSVSREVILRKLLDHGVVTKEYYEGKTAEWNKDYLRRDKSTGGGNFYLTRLAYLGEGFTRVAFENYHRGRSTRTELANHLNMNSRNLPKLERYMRW